MTRSVGKITVVRRVVQGCMLVLFCLPPMLAGWGLAGLFVGGDGEVATPAEGVFFGSLSSSSVAGVPLFDPLGALEVTVASRSLLAASALTGALLVVVVYGLVRGRAFCGWVCPTNLLLEGVEGTVEVDCNEDMEINCRELKGRLEINQLSAVSRVRRR